MSKDKKLGDPSFAGPGRFNITYEVKGRPNHQGTPPKITDKNKEKW